MKQKGLVYTKGKFLPLKKAYLPITDLAVQRGTGLFETLRTYKKIPLALDKRLQRLFKSAKFLGFKLDYSLQFIKAKAILGIKKIKPGEVLVKIIITGGDSDGLIPQGSSRLLILFLPFRAFPSWQYEKGIKVLTIRLCRPLPSLKSLSYISAVVAYQEALRKGYDEALYLDKGGCILEGTNFNFAIIRNTKLIVPKGGLLGGMTMGIVMRLAPECDLKVIRRGIKYSELKSADEAFITSATREIMPVVRVDRIKIGNGKPGKYTKRLLVLYRDYANRKRKE